MKKYILLILILLVTLSLFFFEYIKEPSIEFNTLHDDIWRSKIVYKKIDEISIKKRHEIYGEFIYEMFIGNIPDSAYRKIAKGSDLSVEKVKDIIGEAIALNWEVENCDSSCAK